MTSGMPFGNGRRKWGGSARIITIPTDHGLQLSFREIIPYGNIQDPRGRVTIPAIHAS